MKKLLIILLSALSLTTSAQETIALLEPRVGEGSTLVTAMEKNMVRGELRKAIVNFTSFDAITRVDIDQMMKEQNFQRTGMVSESQIKKLGEMSGADYICVSTLTKSNTEFYLEAYLIHLESGRIFNPASQFGELSDGKLANMLPACHALAKDLTNVNSSNSSAKYHTTVSSSIVESSNVISPQEDYVDIEDCATNISLFHEHTRNQQYIEAYKPWYKVYMTCPDANKAIYSDGAKIIDVLYKATTDINEKHRLAQLAIELNDKRIRYFGNDQKYPTGYILGQKGLAYYDYFNKSKLNEAHECLSQSIKDRGSNSKIRVLVALVEVSYDLFVRNRISLTQFKTDYELSFRYLKEKATYSNGRNQMEAQQGLDEINNMYNKFQFQ